MSNLSSPNCSTHYPLDRCNSRGPENLYLRSCARGSLKTYFYLDVRYLFCLLRLISQGVTRLSHDFYYCSLSLKQSDTLKFESNSQCHSMSPSVSENTPVLPCCHTALVRDFQLIAARMWNPIVSHSQSLCPWNSFYFSRLVFSSKFLHTKSVYVKC
jgi:hypothetical protein